MPRAIEVATQKWIEFESQPFAEGMALEQRIFLFSEGLGKGLKQWEAFRSSPDSLMLLIAALGVERSKSHLRIEIETALKVALPGPHQRTDAEENHILMERLIDRANRKWVAFDTAVKFRDGTSLADKIQLFQTPFLQGVKTDFPMFVDAPESFFQPIMTLGISLSGNPSIEEVEFAFKALG